MTRFKTTARTATAITLLAASPAFAQDTGNQGSDDQPTESQTSEARASTDQGSGSDPVQVLANWSYEPLYEGGWSVENMFDVTEVTDTSGEVIGDVENVIFSNTGEVRGIVAQVGGFWDIGDTHVFVPWSGVSVGDDISQAQVPVNEDEVDNFDVFGGAQGDSSIAEGDVADTDVVDDDLAAGEGVFKATDLIGDYAYLSDGMRYGYVADLIVQDGMISAVVSDAASYGRSGYYAYPYNEGRASPVMGPRYQMPYDQVEVDTIENFDYTQLQSRAE